MIKVTLKNGDVIQTNKYDYDFYTKNIIVDNNFILKEDISKVEKQVKDLTLEEMIKLGFYKSEYTPNIKNYVVFELNKKTHLQHNLTDYIDITSIVKGE